MLRSALKIALAALLLIGLSGCDVGSMKEMSVVLDKHADAVREMSNTLNQITGKDGELDRHRKEAELQFLKLLGELKKALAELMDKAEEKSGWIADSMVTKFITEKRALFEDIARTRETWKRDIDQIIERSGDKAEKLIQMTSHEARSLIDYGTAQSRDLNEQIRATLIAFPDESSEAVSEILDRMSFEMYGAAAFIPQFPPQFSKLMGQAPFRLLKISQTNVLAREDAERVRFILGGIQDPILIVADQQLKPINPTESTFEYIIETKWFDHLFQDLLFSKSYFKIASAGLINKPRYIGELTIYPRFGVKYKLTESGPGKPDMHLTVIDGPAIEKLLQREVDRKASDPDLVRHPERIAERHGTILTLARSYLAYGSSRTSRTPGYSSWTLEVTLENGEGMLLSSLKPSYKGVRVRDQGDRLIIEVKPSF